jgi:hypothetical protein
MLRLACRTSAGGPLAGVVRAAPRGARGLKDKRRPDVPPSPPLPKDISMDFLHIFA